MENAVTMLGWHDARRGSCRIALLTMEEKCRKCGKPLTSAESKSKGFGPVCDHGNVWVERTLTEALHGRTDKQKKGILRKVRGMLDGKVRT